MQILAQDMPAWMFAVAFGAAAFTWAPAAHCWSEYIAPACRLLVRPVKGARVMTRKRMARRRRL
ncbi:hypothetical protein FJY94_02655 [Candidatus Kaiserbacteria bacterium]|nr:hypothetical protein [Candidatus Kaiserbacteria bacterium]